MLTLEEVESGKMITEDEWEEGSTWMTLEEVESGIAAPQPRPPQPQPQPRPPQPPPHPGLRWLRLRAETLRARGLPLGAEDGAVVAYCRTFGCERSAALQLVEVASDGQESRSRTARRRSDRQRAAALAAAAANPNTSKGAGGGGGGEGGGKGGRKGNRRSRREREKWAKREQ